MNGRKAMQAPSLTLGALPPAVSDLLAAVIEALDLPLPAITQDAERAYAAAAEKRMSNVRIVLSTMLDWPTVDISTDAADLRTRTAEVPADYAPFQWAEDGGEQ